MRPDYCPIKYNFIFFIRDRKALKNCPPDSTNLPLAEPIVDGLPTAEPLVKVAPRRSGLRPPGDGVEEAPISYFRRPTESAIWDQIADKEPLSVAKSMSVHERERPQRLRFCNNFLPGHPLEPISKTRWPREGEKDEHLNRSRAPIFFDPYSAAWTFQTSSGR